MAAQFGNLKSEAGLSKLNAFLAHSSYVGGAMPTSDDLETLNGIASAPGNLKHVLRWYNHLQSFTTAERQAWGGATSNGPAAAADEDDEDVDLFGSDEEDDEEKERVKQERLKAYAEKKSKKPGVIAKSSIVLDVKPWGDDTDLDALEKLVRAIECDGLVWGAAKKVPIAYGINKLQIGCVVQDDKVSTDFLDESICAFEDYVQSVDIAAFQKI